MVEAHRRSVCGAILDATAALVTQDGLAAVTMARIAEHVGMTEAALHKYFSGLDAILRAWHDRQVGNHLAYLDDPGYQPADPVLRLDAVLRAYAVVVHQTHEHHTTGLGATLHHRDGIADARRHLHETVRSLIAEGVATGDIRDDIAPDELAEHCLHAVSAAGGEDSVAAIRRLVTTTVAGLLRP
jgi:AcrR family transcriptional regulator